MNNPLVALTVPVCAAFGAIAIVEASARSSVRRSLICFELRFPRNLEAEAVQSFLVGLTGLLPPWWRRWLAMPFVVLEIEATSVGITHRLCVPASWSSAIEQLLQASLSGVRFDRLDIQTDSTLAAAEYRLSDRRRPLRVDAEGISSKLLASLQPLDRGERVLVQWGLAPAPLTRPPVSLSSQNRSSWIGRAWLSDPALETPETRSALKAKHSATVNSTRVPRREPMAATGTGDRFTRHRPAGARMLRPAGRPRGGTSSMPRAFASRDRVDRRIVSCRATTLRSSETSGGVANSAESNQAFNDRGRDRLAALTDDVRAFLHEHDGFVERAVGCASASPSISDQGKP